MPYSPTGRRRNKGRCLAAAAAAVLLAPGLAQAHGFAGKRFFPATLTFDDPVPMDEFDLTYGHINDVKQDSGYADQQSVDVEYAKSITHSIAVSIGTAYNRFKFTNASAVNGMDNLAVGVKALGGVDPQAESVWSLGLDVDLAGTGSSSASEDFSVFSPTVFFGKGLGNLSSSLLRPLEVSGAAGVSLPTRGNVSRAVNLDFAVMYNFSYMAAFVRDIHLPGPLHDSLAIVEVPMSMCFDQGCGGTLTGTINPGFMLYNTMGQVALELPIPINSNTGKSIGVLLQVHLYIDDLFPHTLGKPIFDD